MAIFSFNGEYNTDGGRGNKFIFMLSWLLSYLAPSLLLSSACCYSGVALVVYSFGISWHTRFLYMRLLARLPLISPSDGEPSVISLSWLLPSWVDPLFSWFVYRSLDHIPLWDTGFCPWTKNYFLEASLKDTYFLGSRELVSTVLCSGNIIVEKKSSRMEWVIGVMWSS